MAVPVQLVAAHVAGASLVLLGRDASGRSVAVELSDARAYLWAALAEGEGPERVAARFGPPPADRNAPPPPAECGEVRRFRRFHGYDPATYPFVKVTLARPGNARSARDALADRELAEADVDFASPVCADLGVSPGAWFEVGAGAQQAA